jgi:hypothetical protein
MRRAIGESLGITHVPIISYPGVILTDESATFLANVAPAVVDALTAGAAGLTDAAAADTPDPTPRRIVVRGDFEEVLEEFEARGWSDGLPVVPPTVERVEAFLAHIRSGPDEVLGTLLPDQREVTPWNVAVNGVMAGVGPSTCRCCWPSPSAWSSRRSAYRTLGRRRAGSRWSRSAGRWWRSWVQLQDRRCAWAGAPIPARAGSCGCICATSPACDSCPITPTRAPSRRRSTWPWRRTTRRQPVGVAVVPGGLRVRAAGQRGQRAQLCDDQCADLLRRGDRRGPPPDDRQGVRQRHGRLVVLRDGVLGVAPGAGARPEHCDGPRPSHHFVWWAGNENRNQSRGYVRNHTQGRPGDPPDRTLSVQEERVQ